MPVASASSITFLALPSLDQGQPERRKNDAAYRKLLAFDDDTTWISAKPPWR
jgi:hypothetical protein